MKLQVHDEVKVMPGDDHVSGTGTVLSLSGERHVIVEGLGPEGDEVWRVREDRLEFVSRPNNINQGPQS